MKVRTRADCAGRRPVRQTGFADARGGLTYCPVLQHVIVQVYQEQLAGYTADLDPKRTRIAAFGPRRALTDPVILAASSGLMATGYWLYLLPLSRGWLSFW